jgi:MFS transporter, FSR family, fosmidomycin resistance protein
MTQLKSKFQTGNAITISLAHLLHDVYSSFLAPLLPLLIEKLAFSYTAAGFLTVLQRGPSLLNPLIGILADKFQVKYFIVITPSITAISMSLLGLAPNYAVLALIMVTMGMSATFFHVPAPVLIKHVSGNRVGLGMSFFMLGGEGARSLGPIFILTAVSWWGLEGTYRLIPIGLAISVILYFKLNRIDGIKQKAKHTASATVSATFQRHFKTLMLLSGYLSSHSLMKGGLSAFLPIYMTEKGVSIWLAGISLAVLQFAGVLGTLAAGPLSDIFGRRKILFVIAVVCPFLLLGFSKAENMVFIMILLFITGIFIFAPQPVMLARVNEIRTDHPSFINGTYMALNFITTAVAIMIVGFLGDKIGLAKTYEIAAYLAFGAIPLALMIQNKKIKPETL